MNQIDMFAPDAPDELARQRANLGITQALDHSLRIDPDWQASAVRFVSRLATSRPTMLAEDVRALAEANGLATPADPRAWGAVMRRAAREGIVCADGYAPANSSNRSPKTLWRSLL